MVCPRCNKESLRIEVAEDSYYKVVKCLWCGWYNWLKNLNKRICLK